MRDQELTIEAICLKVGEAVANCEDMTRHVMEHPDLANNSRMEDLALQRPIWANPAALGEVKANIMLAVRHLEDAQARLGFAAKHANRARRPS